MKKILFLTDFSDLADQAYRYALSLAEKITAEIHILHVVPIIEATDLEEQQRIHPFAEFYKENLEAQQWQAFQDEVKRLEQIALANDQWDVPVYFHFEKGYFQEIALDYTSEKGINLVVMGTAGSKTLDAQLFGTHTSKLIDALQIPVLAIPQRAIYAAMRNFATAVLLTKNEIPLIAQLKKQLAPFQKPFTCVHIAATAKEAANAHNRATAWLEQLSDQDIQLHILNETDSICGLKKYVSEQHIDVLCLLHRNLSVVQRFFKTNYTKNLLQQSETALLIYPSSL
ncbi:universal stress protein [Flavobacterium sp. JP2137]|uniref:universal stress protein n=1 Tax=Flavobacterium sp. JP2137 TaxID=3414510 RepID=UPI003D2FD472